MRRSVGQRRLVFREESETCWLPETVQPHNSPLKRRKGMRGFNRLVVSNQLIGESIRRRGAWIFIQATAIAAMTSLVVSVLLSISWTSRNERKLFSPVLSKQDVTTHRVERPTPLSILFFPAYTKPSSPSGSVDPEHVDIPTKLDQEQRKEARIKDFGSLKILPFAGVGMVRAMHRDIKEEERPHDTDTEQLTDDMDNYYSFDDDFNRSPYRAYEDKTLQFKKHCRRTSWHRDLFLNCNLMHEFDFLSVTERGNVSALREGSYRQIFRADLPERSLAVKAYYWAANYDYSDYEFTRMDGLVSEIFSSSPNIVDIYGFCGLWMLVELMPHGDVGSVAFLSDEEYAKQASADWSTPRNHLSPTQKLLYSLEMADALALLHSYPGGVIVHDDVHPGQFLITEEGHLKLHDFNRAEIMLWNEKDGEYCRYRNHPGNGDWRSPEEYKDLPLDEKIDVWSLGNNMYALLTGLDVFVNFPSTEEKQLVIMKGQTPFIHPDYSTRSFAEGKLVEVIKKCWVYEPDNRIDIFGVVDLLRAAVEENRKNLLQRSRVAGEVV